MRKEVNRSDRVGIFDRQLKVHKCSMRGTGSEEWKNGSTESNKKKRQLPHPCTTQPARMGHPRKETRGKIKACPTRQWPWPTPGHCYCVSGLDRGQKAGRDTRPAKKSDGAAMGRLREL